MLPIDLDMRAVGRIFSLQLRSLPMSITQKGGKNEYQKKSIKGNKRIAV